MTGADAGNRGGAKLGTSRVRGGGSFVHNVKTTALWVIGVS